MLPLAASTLIYTQLPIGSRRVHTFLFTYHRDGCQECPLEVPAPSYNIFFNEADLVALLDEKSLSKYRDFPVFDSVGN